MLKTISASNARQNFADIINTVAYAKEPVGIRKRNKLVAIVVPPNSYDYSTSAPADLPVLKDAPTNYRDDLAQVKGNWFSFKDFKNTRKEIEKRLNQFI